MNKSQKVIAELKTGRSLTGLEIWTEFAVYRASVIVNRYRKKHGYNSIKTKMLTVRGSTFANYSINV